MTKKLPLYLLVTAMALISVVASDAVAQRPYRASDQQLETLLTRIENRADLFRNSVDRALDRSTINNTNRETEINQYVSDFQAATTRLRERFTSRNSVSADVREVLNRGRAIDNFMRANRLDTASERNWQNLRTDLDTLAGYYNVTWNWNSGGNDNAPYDRGQNNRRGDDQRYNLGRLEGTFTLDPQRSDDARQVADRAVESLTAQEAERVRRMIERRLEPPTQIALNVTGRRVTMASSSAQQVSFDADGRAQVETRPNGRTVRTTATLTGNNRLTVSSTGDRGSDFSVTFDAIEGGRAMRVTRQLYSERLSQPVTVRSVYNRTSEIAEFDLYRDRPFDNNRNDNRNDNRDTTVSGNYHVENGTRLTAVLDNNLNTEQIREGDRFTLTVQSPATYAGAIVEGHVTKVDRSGRLAGNSELALEFDSIRLRNGSSYNFDAFIEQVRTPGGKTIRVDNEGGVRESRGQTQRTVTRAGIGAAIGAIIGGIAGGGSGAAVGAAVGAGAGTGSVLLQGRDDVNLAAGTVFTISSITSRN